MGIKIDTDRTDVHGLSEVVGRVRRHIEQAIEELARIRERIPDPSQIREAFAPAPLDERRDLSNSCVSLELALEDTKKWARRLADKTNR